jgi:hypothetical protein
MDSTLTLQEIKSLKLVITKCFAPYPSDVLIYNEIYRVWRSTWEIGVKELYGSETLPSDHFIRQDIVAAVFKGDECLASCCYRLINLKIPAHCDDSWFKPWPQEIIKEIAMQTPLALMPSWLTVNPSYRYKESGYPIHLARLMMEVLNFMTINYNAQVAFGVSRNDRSVNKLLKHIGGVDPVRKDVQYEGFYVDLFKFSQHELALRIPEFSIEVHKLWRDRIDLTIQNTERKFENETRI